MFNRELQIYGRRKKAYVLLYKVAEVLRTVSVRTEVHFNNFLIYIALRTHSLSYTQTEDTAFFL